MYIRLKEAEEYFQRETLHREWKKGIEQGIEKGKKYSTLIIAKSMKEDGADFNLISKYTGLSIEEIENL